MMKTLMTMYVVLLCLLFIITPATNTQHSEVPKHYNIILLGATGDLAKKYLWKGLFDLYSKHYKQGMCLCTNFMSWFKLFLSTTNTSVSHIINEMCKDDIMVQGINVNEEN